MKENVDLVFVKGYESTKLSIRKVFGTKTLLIKVEDNENTQIFASQFLQRQSCNSTLCEMNSLYGTLMKFSTVWIFADLFLVFQLVTAA